jgi:hypothetical protein
VEAYFPRVSTKAMELSHLWQPNLNNLPTPKLLRVLGVIVREFDAGTCRMVQDAYSDEGEFLCFFFPAPDLLGLLPGCLHAEVRLGPD